MESPGYWEYVLNQMPLATANISSCCKGDLESLHLYVDLDDCGFR